jgi:hypothetical protein
MRSTKKGLKSYDICNLIKTCSVSGVLELNYGELHIKFASKDIEAPSEPAIAGRKSDATKSTVIEQDSIEQDELKTKQDQLDLMLIEDPAEYERLLIAGELEDGHSRAEPAL